MKELNNNTNIQKTVTSTDTLGPSKISQTPLQLGDENKKRTVGNKIFDWGVYSSIAWIGVSVMSLLTAHEAIHGDSKSFNWLRKLHGGLKNKLENGLSKTLLKNAPKEKIEMWADDTAMFSMLGLGGTTLMAPIKWMEDNRLKLAAKIDNALGTTPPDPELVAKEPKQHWGSVLSGRALSVAMSYTAFIAMGPVIARKISNGFGEAFTKGWMKLRPADNRAKVFEWAKLGTFDVLFTAITAAVTYAFSRFVARRTDKTEDVEYGLMTFDPATPTPQAPVYPVEEVVREKEANEKRVALRRKIEVPKELYTQKVAESESTLAPRGV